MDDNRTFICDFSKPEAENLMKALAYEAKAKELSDTLFNAMTEALNFLNLRNTHDNRARVLGYLNMRGGAVRFVKMNYERYRQLAKEKEEKELKAKREAEFAENLKVIRERAVQYLLDHGKRFGLDFNLDTAIAVANETAYDVEVAIRKNASTIYDFAGSDSCEDCAGWDGESHRCECGNRRVYWAAEGDFTNMTLYAEAY